MTELRFSSTSKLLGVARQETNSAIAQEKNKLKKWK
jgi:hypothetical protein